MMFEAKAALHNHSFSKDYSKLMNIKYCILLYIIILYIIIFLGLFLFGLLCLICCSFMPGLWMFAMHENAQRLKQNEPELCTDMTRFKMPFLKFKASQLCKQHLHAGESKWI